MTQGDPIRSLLLDTGRIRKGRCFFPKLHGQRPQWVRPRGPRRREEPTPDHGQGALQAPDPPGASACSWVLGDSPVAQHPPCFLEDSALSGTLGWPLVAAPGRSFRRHQSTGSGAGPQNGSPEVADKPGLAWPWRLCPALPRVPLRCVPTPGGASALGRRSRPGQGSVTSLWLSSEFGDLPAPHP